MGRCVGITAVCRCVVLAYLHQLVHTLVGLSDVCLRNHHLLFDKWYEMLRSREVLSPPQREISVRHTARGRMR